jgi:3-oxoadipate enol-lactonase
MLLIDATLIIAGRLAKCEHHAIMPAMAYVDTSRGRIGVTQSGQGTATPLVFLHGVGSDKSVWHPQQAYFAATRPSYSFDYPGYGESDYFVGATRDDFAASILAAMDALDIAEAHISGLSLGGVVAIALHARASERCASLVLADTFAVHPDGQAIYDRSVAASRDLGMAELAAARAEALLGSQCSKTIHDEVVATMSRIEIPAYVLGAQAVWLADQTVRARAIRVPTLILCGDEDAITPPALSKSLSELIPGAQLELIERSGHLANLERPTAFNRAIERFIATVE